MAFEALICENWICDTLAADATLAGHLATDGRSPGYQVGVYSHAAPQIDARSKRAPATPYIVVSFAGNRTPDETVICGDRVLAEPMYRVTAWDTQGGSVSVLRLQNIADRIDALLDNIVCGTTPPSWCRRVGTDIPVAVQTDGRVDYGLSATYVFQVQV